MIKIILITIALFFSGFVYSQSDSSSVDSRSSAGKKISAPNLAPTKTNADGGVVETNSPVDPYASQKSGQPTTPGLARGQISGSAIDVSNKNRASVDGSWVDNMKKESRERNADIDEMKAKAKETKERRQNMLKNQSAQ
jgi:hypothetical protein